MNRVLKTFSWPGFLYHFYTIETSAKLIKNVILCGPKWELYKTNKQKAIFFFFSTRKNKTFLQNPLFNEFWSVLFTLTKYHQHKINILYLFTTCKSVKSNG